MAQATAIAASRIPGKAIRIPVVLVVGAIGLLAFVSAPGHLLGDAVFVGTSAFAAGACLYAIRCGRHEARAAWRAVASALVLMTLGNAMTLGSQLPVLAGVGVVGDVFYLAAYLPLFQAAYRFGRGTRRSDTTVFMDAAVVGLAAVPVLWELLVEASVPNHAPGIEPLLAIAVPVLDVALLSLAAPLVLFRYSRSASATLFIAGLTIMAVGDSLFAVRTLNGLATAGFLPNIAWLTSYLVLAGSSLVPSARQLGAARDPRPGTGDRPRLVVLAAALLISPLVTLRETSRTGESELVLFAILALVIAGLVVVRLQQTIAQLRAADLRFRGFMSHDGIIAVIKDAAGRYLYMNDVAQRAPRNGGADWYGRTDDQLYPGEMAARRSHLDALVRARHESIVETLEAHGRTWHTERFEIPGKGGEVGLLGLDISDRLRAEREVQFQARLLESVRDAVVVVDPEGRFTYWNRGAQDIFGFSAEEVLGEHMTARLAPEAVAQVENLWHAISDGDAEIADFPTTRRDGARVWLNARMSPITSEDGTPAGFLAIVKDVTARKQSELELHRLGLAIDHANDAVIVTDGDDRVTYVNPAFVRMTGFTAAEVVGERPADHPEGRSFARALEHARRTTVGWRGDLVDRRRDGTDLIAQTSISPISADGAPTAGFVTIKRDVTHERAAERAAERQARERALIAEMLASLRSGDTPDATAAAVCSQVLKLPELSIATLVTFDSNGIATVLGQQHVDGEGVVGMELTRERSDYLRNRANAGPWVEHWVSDPSHPYAPMLDELGIVGHAYAPMVVDGRLLGLLIGGSDRIDGLDRLTERLPALVEYAAISTTLLAGPVADRLAKAQLREILRRIIDARQFQIVFQPIVELATRSILGYEGLTRFDDGVPPDARFQQAMDLGLGLELEMACVRTTLMAAEQLPADAWLNVNVSPELVLSGVAEALLPEGARAVVLEITEHHAITDYGRFRDAVAPIRDRVRIAIDDAGAGFASLRHIVELAPSLVKLDRSLVAGIADDAARQAVVAGMVEFARSAGLTLIAEGIETEAELAVLRRIGVPLGQGYLLGRPRPGVRRRRARATSLGATAVA